MTRTVASLFALILSIMLLVSGNAFLMTLLGIRLSLEAIDPATIGRVLVCYSIGFVAGTLYVNRIIERVGHIRAFAAFAALASVTALLYPMALTMVLWALLRALSGFCMAGVLLVIESWFSSRATNANRGALFAVYQIVFFVSVAGGQLIVNVGDPESFKLFSIAAILLSLALVPLSLTRMPAPAIEVVERMSVFTLLRQSTTGIGGALICGVLLGAFYALGPVYATMIGLDLQQTSLFMAIAIVAAMILAWPLGRICDRHDRRRVMLCVSFIGAVAALAAAFLGVEHPVLLIAAVGAFTGLSAALYPIAVAITNDRLEQHHIVSASATLLLSYGIGSVIGPLAMSELIGIIGPQGLFMGCAGFLILLAAMTAYYIVTTDDIPVEAQEHFVATMPQSSTTLAEMDPRNEDFHVSPEIQAMEEEEDARHPEL